MPIKATKKATKKDVSGGEQQLFQLAEQVNNDPSAETYAMVLYKYSPMSIIRVNYRSIFEDNYPAKWTPGVCELMVQLHSSPGDLVADIMCGSGECVLVAAALGRKALGVDINPEAIRLCKEKFAVLQKKLKPEFLDMVTFENADCTESIPAADNSVKLIVTSPPFGLTIDAAHDQYSNNPKDIANSDTYEQWRVKYKLVLKQAYRILQPGGLIAIELRPRSKAGHSYPLDKWVWQDAMEIGFEFFTEYIEDVPPLAMWSFGSADQRKPMPAHSYLTLYQKPKNAVNSKLM